MTADPLLLEPLLQWCHRQEENFFTEALAGALRVGLRERRDRMAALFSEIFGVSVASDDLEDPVRVVTQYDLGEHGIADLAVVGKRLLFLVESKLAAEEGAGQLENYARFLSARPSVSRRAFMYLTDPFRATRALAPDDAQVRFAHKRWHAVCKTLAVAFAGNPVTEFVARELEELLRGGGIMVEKVNVNLIDGLREACRLRDMLESALARCPVVESRSASSGQRWIGWTLTFEKGGAPRAWIAFTFDQPSRIQYMLLDDKTRSIPLQRESIRRLQDAMATALESEDCVKTGAPFDPEVQAPYLDLQASGFFDKDLDRQAQMLARFIQHAADLVCAERG